MCLGDEGDLPGHLGVIDPPAVFKVPSLPLSTGLLVVALTLHRVNNPILRQHPKICREKNKSEKSWDSDFRPGRYGKIKMFHA